MKLTLSIAKTRGRSPLLPKLADRGMHFTPDLGIVRQSRWSGHELSGEDLQQLCEFDEQVEPLSPHFQFNV